MGDGGDDRAAHHGALARPAVVSRPDAGDEVSDAASGLRDSAGSGEQRGLGEGTHQLGRVTFASPEEVVGSVHDLHPRTRDPSPERSQVRDGAERVVCSCQQQCRSTERAEGRRVGERGEPPLPLAERHRISASACTSSWWSAARSATLAPKDQPASSVGPGTSARTRAIAPATSRTSAWPPPHVPEDPITPRKLNASTANPRRGEIVAHGPEQRVVLAPPLFGVGVTQSPRNREGRPDGVP